MSLAALDGEKFQEQTFLTSSKTFFHLLMIITSNAKILVTPRNAGTNKTSGFGILPLLLACVLSIFIFCI